MREAAMSSIARVIFFVDSTDLIRARYSRSETATSASLLLLDLLLVLVLERLVLLLAGLDRATLGGLELLGEGLERLVQGGLGVVGEVQGLADRLQHALVRALEVVDELALEASDVLCWHAVELP